MKLYFWYGRLCMKLYKLYKCMPVCYVLINVKDLFYYLCCVAVGTYKGGVQVQV